MQTTLVCILFWGWNLEVLGICIHCAFRAVHGTMYRQRCCVKALLHAKTCNVWYLNTQSDTELEPYKVFGSLSWSKSYDIQYQYSFHTCYLEFWTIKIVGWNRSPPRKTTSVYTSVMLGFVFPLELVNTSGAPCTKGFSFTPSNSSSAPCFFAPCRCGACLPAADAARLH